MLLSFFRQRLNSTIFSSQSEKWKILKLKGVWKKKVGRTIFILLSVKSRWLQFVINKDLEPSAILGPPFINQLIRCISILLKIHVNRKNRDGRIDLRIFKFWIVWLPAASPQELCIRFLPVTVCVMAYMEWRGNSKIFGEEGLSRTFLIKMRLFLFTVYNINYHFISSFKIRSTLSYTFRPYSKKHLFENQVKFIFLLRKKQIEERHWRPFLETGA